MGSCNTSRNSDKDELCAETPLRPLTTSHMGLEEFTFLLVLGKMDCPDSDRTEWRAGVGVKVHAEV